MRNALGFALVPVLLVGIVSGLAAQAGRSNSADFDPARKGAWRFLDDDVDALRVEGGKAYAAGDYKAAARQFMAYLYRHGQDASVIYNLARCYSRMGDADAAVELLNRLVPREFVHPELLQADKEFDPIRDSRAFREHLKSLGGFADTLGQSIAVSGPRMNLCRLRLPASFDAGKAYPLVVGLHGSGASGDNIMQSLTAAAFPGMICAAPDAPYSREDLAVRPGQHFNWFLPDADRAQRPTMDPPTSEYIQNVVAEVSLQYRVSHVILLGFSQGVSAAYLTALRYPDRVSGVIAIAGGFPRDSFTSGQIKAGSRLRVMIAHGTDDRQVGLASSERARDFLRENGYRVQFETFEGGHTNPPAVMGNAGLWIKSWLSDAPAGAPREIR